MKKCSCGEEYDDELKECPRCALREMLNSPTVKYYRKWKRAKHFVRAPHKVKYGMHLVE